MDNEPSEFLVEFTKFRQHIRALARTSLSKTNPGMYSASVRNWGAPGMLRGLWPLLSPYWEGESHNGRSFLPTFLMSNLR